MILSDFLKGKFKYDADGQLIFLVKPDGYLQRIIDLRGWGAIQNLFRKKDQSIDIVEAGKFQDELGEWIAAALNEKLSEIVLPEPVSPDVSLLRDAWSVCWRESVSAGYSIDAIQKSFENWLDERKIAWRNIEPEKREWDVLVGHLNRDYGYKHFSPAKKGTEVFENKDRYYFWITQHDPSASPVKCLFYKQDLKKHIDFLQPVKNNVASADNHTECKACGKQNSESCNTCDVINPQYH